MLESVHPLNMQFQLFLESITLLLGTHVTLWLLMHFLSVYSVILCVFVFFYLRKMLFVRRKNCGYEKK